MGPKLILETRRTKISQILRNGWDCLDINTTRRLAGFFYSSQHHTLTRQDQFFTKLFLLHSSILPENMGLIKTGLTLAGGYGLIKAASKYVLNLPLWLPSHTNHLQ